MSDSKLKPPADQTSLRPPSVVSLSPSNLQLPATASQKLSSSSSSGSATGNPRNKCALKPGYSLMSWVRLCNSGADLSGTQGRVIPVTREELARHNQVTDAWIALRGKVFNVTRYMDFHPGGVDELMRGVGCDATKLFDEVHAWVNYPQLLGKCYVGPLTEGKATAKVEEVQVQLMQPPPKPAEIVPRFDWIQQSSQLTLYFYTRRFANPGLWVRTIENNQIEVRILIGSLWHLLDFQLFAAVTWPPKSAHIAVETGRIELVLVKKEAAPWPNYGTHKIRKGATLTEELFDFEILTNQQINHDSFELSLQSREQKVLMLLPLGYHVDLEVNIQGADIQRSYTPIPHLYLSKEQGLSPTSLNFLIKNYDQGKVSAYLKQLQQGASIQLGLPRGQLVFEALTKHRHLLFLAAGSGLTPFLSLIQPLLQRNTNRIESLHLMYFNKNSEDIWLKHKLLKLQQLDERFSCQHLLSQAEEPMPKQRISLELLEPLFRDKTKFTYVMLCGPTGFNTAAMEILTKLQMNSNQIHVFQG